MCYVIGLDLGTTCIKALILDETGRILSSASRDDKLLTPHRGWAEQNAEHWVELSAEVIKEAVSEAAIDPGSIRALSVSSQGITIVPVDRDYKPLRYALSWLDIRPENEIEFICSRISAEDIFSITGKSLNPAYSLPKILWLMRNEPEIFRKTSKLLLPHDFLCAFLCGCPVTDHTMASGTMLYDLTTQQWSSRLLDLFEIDPCLLPVIKWSGTPVRTLTKEASHLTGLPETTLLVTGGQDQKIAAHGASLKAGTATISFGTCAAMEFLLESFPAFPSHGFAASSYISPETRVLEACINTAGAAIKWARDTLFPEMSFDDMNTLAESCTSSGGVFFYPFLQGSGTPHNTSAQGAFTGLTLAASKAELIRAIYEGIVMEVYTNLYSARIAGVTVEQLYIFGGGSKGAVINQMLADITGCEIQAFSTTEMSAFGAAKLAASAIGIHNFTLPVSGIWEPDMTQNTRYKELYQLYQANIPAVLNLTPAIK